MKTSDTMNRNRRLIAMTTAKAVWSCLLCVALWSAGSHSHAQEKPDAAKAKATTSLPDIRELWVPSEELDAVLKKYPRAVMLTREQYDALLRDSLEARAEDKAEEDVAPPAEMIVRNVVLSGELHAEVAVIRADYEVEVFVDKQWTEIPLVLPRERLAKISVDGDGVGAVRSMADDTKDSPLQLLVRGRGAHRVAAEYHLPVQRGTDGKSITLTNPGIAAARLDLLLADGIELDSDLPFAVSEDGKLARFAFPAEQADYEIRWAAGNIAPIEESAIFQTCTYLYSIDSARVQGDLGLVLHSHLRDLPVAVAIALPPEVRVLSVEGSELLRWDRGDDGVVRVEMVEGRRRAADLRLLVEAPVELGAGQAAEITLPAAEVVGVHRASGTLALIGSDDVKVQSVETGRLTVPVLDELAAEIRTHPNFVNGFRFPVLSGAPVVTLSPVTQRFNGQLDTRVELMRDAIYVQRDLTVVPLEGRIFETRIDLPAGEEVVAVRWQNPTVGTHAHSLVMPDGPEWDRLPTADGEPVGLRIAWPGGLLAGGGRALVIESRRDPENWFSLGAEAVDLKFASATIYKAEAVSGYLAVAFDESFRIETADVSGLEARDARATPVKGRLAWFHLRDYALDLRAARRAPEFDAVLTSYLGPLQSSLEIEGQLDLDIRFAPLAELVVQAPTAVAALMRFDSPLIASKSLDEETGRWTLKFHRELLGEQRLRFHCSVPFEMAESEGDDAAAADGDGEEHFAVQVPVLKIDGVQRLRGQWLVEANTDTALSFEAEGLDEIDLLLASHVEGYQPRHRVIAAYDFRGTEHSLKLSGTRHEAAELLSTVIDDLQIDSVLSTDGLDRHQARIKLRTAGEQFLELGLPSGAELWTLTLDGEAVKPVTSSAGTLRIGLPADAGGRAEVEIKVVYQLRREEWGGSGRRELQPVLLSKSVPVLHSEWRLHLPEGFDYQKFRSNLRERFEVVDRTLLGQAAEAMGEMGSAAADGWTNYSVVDSRAADESFGDDDWKMDAAAAEPNAMPASRATVLASDGGNTGIYENERKLKEIILPTVDFDDTPLSSALEFLSQKSAELDTTEADPAKHGLNIILSAGNGGIGAPAPASGGMGFDDPAAPDFSSGSSVGETKITLKLTNVPLVEALRYTTSLANLKYKVEPHAVVIVPLSSPDADLYTNVYQVPPSFLNSSGAFGGGGGGPVDPFAPAADSGGALHSRTTAKQVLEQAGVTFGEGSSAIYNAATSQLIIRSTGDQMELVEAMIDSIKHSGGDVPQPNFMPLVAGDELTAEDLGAFRDLYENELAFRDSVNSGNSMEQRAIGAVEQRLMQSIVSNVDFENTPLSDALSLLSQQTGVPISLGDEVAHRAAVGFDNEGEVGQTKITLKLSNVPAIEALRYTTSLAGLKWRATPDGVEVVPRHTPDTNLKTLVVEVPPNVLSMGIDDSPLTARDLLERAGVTFPPGAGAAYNRSTQRLAVKTSEDQLELVEAYFASMDYVVDRGGSDALKTLMRGAEGNGVVGLIPIDFELPEAGRVYRFEGLFAPEPLRFRYVNWERQVRVAWWWILVGAVAFVMVALRWRRPWFLGLMGALVLGFLPKALLPSLMAVCNALMIGWLGALGLLVVWRVAGMLHRWHRREALRLAAGSVRSDVGGEEVAS